MYANPIDSRVFYREKDTGNWNGVMTKIIQHFF